MSDVALGATSVHLADLIRPEGDESQRSWTGWVPLTWRPPETNDDVVLGLGAGQIGMVAGAAVAGPMGAAGNESLASVCCPREHLHHFTRVFIPLPPSSCWRSHKAFPNHAPIH